MGLGVLDPSHGGYLPATHPSSYPSSLPSSASSQDSVFSDALSTASSRSSDNDNDPVSCSKLCSGSIGVDLRSKFEGSRNGQTCLPPPQRPSLVPSQDRQNPRRSSSDSRKTPTLVRQDERKSCFVNDLVDSATNMVEVIWPLSMVACNGQNSQGRGILPLRKYIEETLRRSRTSYSTLQVALYYLVLIMPHVPRCEFTMEQTADSPCFRALQCGRRMFLAALILASKYLQDRNYSAKAWSKMSGLKVSEINTNERIFLQAVQWKLHIPDQVFKRWTDIVLAFTAGQGLPSPVVGFVTADHKTAWRHIIPYLTPSLDHHRLPGGNTNATPASPVSPAFAASATPTPTRADFQTISSSRENTPTPMSVLPRYLEPRPELNPPTPGLTRLGPLPTPQMTPASVAASTPAVSACGSSRGSMTIAMREAQNNNFCRMIVDRFPGSRSSSLAPSIASSRSSPESMITDLSRSSRSSSISSIATTSTGAPSQTFSCLAKLATCRSAGRPTRADSPMMIKKEAAIEPTTIYDDADLVASPDFSGFSIKDDGMTPVRATKSTSVPSNEPCKKRVWSGRNSLHGSYLQDNVRALLRDCHQDKMDILPDNAVATSPIETCILRRAFKSLSRSSSSASVKSVQPPCSIRRESSGRLPVCKDSGKKRTCCSTKSACQSPNDVREICV